jgi:hypothetical protein
MVSLMRVEVSESRYMWLAGLAGLGVLVIVLSIGIFGS